jgi:hypothetical protein
MRHNPIEPDVLKSRRAVKKGAEFYVGNAESSHPCIDLEVVIHNHPRRSRGTIELIEQIYSK